MKERLIQLLDLEQLSPSKFADIIGVQRSSISHVISGRNKPSYDFLQKTLKAFPGLNASWLLLGEGTMYEQMGRNVSGNLFDAPDRSEVPSEGNISGPDRQLVNTEATENSMQGVTLGEETQADPVPFSETGKTEAADAIQEPTKGAGKRIVQVMIIYEDDTFRAFDPAN